MGHVIDKQIDYCYGHRVHSQQLDSKYSIDSCCKCRHPHQLGHQGTIKIGLEASELERGMVTDFKHLNIIKKIVDDYFDHKFIIDINDPLFENMFSELQKDKLIWHESKLFATPDLEHYLEQNIPLPVYEKLEGVVIVPFVPTSENLCKFLAQLADFTLKGLEGYGSRFKLSYIDFWETPKSHCRYTLQLISNEKIEIQVKLGYSET